MDMQQLVYAAWRDLRESDAVLRDLPTMPPLETFLDVVTAARMALRFDTADEHEGCQLLLFGD